MKNRFQIFFFIMTLLTILLFIPTFQYNYWLLTEYNKLLTCNNGICFILSIGSIVLGLILTGTFVLCLFFTVIFLRKSLKQENNTRPNVKIAAPTHFVSEKITAILEAVLSADYSLVRTALEDQPEELNTAYAQNGNTPLHVAALNGYTDIVRLLLSQPGIDTTRTNNDGKTALDLAREKGFTEIAQLLENK